MKAPLSFYFYLNIKTLFNLSTYTYLNKTSFFEIYIQYPFMGFLICKIYFTHKKD